MTTVGIKQLKAHLSRYVRKAQRGERVIITERGKEIAELVPLSSEREGVLRLASQGKLTWSGGKPAGLDGVAVHGKPLSETVLEERR
ncbi:MAG: type II toxin-antitoxin system prevent-host-death family antitoxin [Nitrospirota bacterium]